MFANIMYAIACRFVDDDMKKEADIVCASSSSSALFIDILLLVFFRDTSCFLDNRYFGHNNHLLLHYIKKRKPNVMLCEDLFHEC